ncbi:hypothetical protein KC19_3G118400 [Ceratodon purpureus]|uniref:Aminotransferase class V domain-containing protein n=1 Tax=Ceratodon purpureus TaxID=3225 RepID=A0A8T0IHE6_CERPU|nr:hypothetical protein KC19_3G118400 [Ceratodon purpureus]
MTSERKDWANHHGGCHAEAPPAQAGRCQAGAAAAPGTDDEFRQEAGEVRGDVAREEVLGPRSGPAGRSDSQSRGGSSRHSGCEACGGAEFSCGGAEEELEGEEGGASGSGGGRLHVPPAALDGLAALAAPESARGESGVVAVTGGAIAAARAEPERHAAVDDDSDAVRSREMVVQREFAHHHSGVARLNNGSFGSAPRCVLDDQAQWNLQWLRHPDEFCWDPLSDGFLAARKGLAELIGGPDVDEVVLLENATTGAAIVAVDCMWGFLEGRFARGDGIVMFDSAYGAVKKCFQGYCVRAGAHLLEYKMPFPVKSKEEILHSFEEFLKKEKADHPARIIRLAILDHITSMPSIILPVRDLVRLCRTYGVEQVLVDGAHAIGSVDINVHEIDADYYMANVHKWLFAPPVVAFFHAKAHHLSRLHHPVVSHSYGTGLLNETYWVGTRDYSALLSVPKAIQFVKDFFGDLENYRMSNHDKVVEMGEMLARSWGTCLGAPRDLFASMAMVGLPPGLNIHSQDDALKMRTRLREEFHVEVPLCYAGDSMSEKDGSKVVAYARISHQVYNKLEDYYVFRDAVNMMLAEGA